MPDGDQRAKLAVLFIGSCSLMLTAGLVVVAVARDTIPASLAALVGTVVGYLAGLLGPDRISSSK